MEQAMGMLDFFVLESGEYLERLDALVQAPAGALAQADEVLRTVRAFRGSALMASQAAVARAAQGLEAVARALRDGRVAWDERVRGELVRAVDDCKVLLSRVRAPAAGDAAMARALGDALERLAGRPSGPRRASGADGGLDAGARAFVAREAAAIASALDAVARSLAADLAARDALVALPPAMSALKGVAVVTDLPPLADILAGIEGAVKEVNATSGAVPSAAAEAFDAAARTMARAAREVVDLGRPTSDSEEARAFAARLLGAFAREGDIVPVEMLFPNDEGPHVVRRGAPPAALSPVELVSLGEYLATSASDLKRAASPVIRDLKLFGVAVSLRPLAGAGGSAASGALGRFADAGRSAIEHGRATASIDAFATVLGDAAEALRHATGDDAPLAARLDAAGAALATLAPAPRPAPAAGPPPAARPRRTRVVPDLAPREERAAAPSEEEGAVEPPPDLADAYSGLEQLIEARGLPLGTLAELLAGGTGAWAPEDEEAGVVPIESLAPDDERPIVPIEALAPEGEPPTVPIEALLYQGSDALRRAMELRPDIDAAAGSGDAARLAELLHEVFDLVGLGIGAGR